MKILFVEDNRDLRNSVKEGLEAKGYTVDLAADGNTGWELSQVNDYDLIVLDINLPYKTGVELVKSIRQNNSEVPVMALTARDGIDDKVTGLTEGFDDYLTKPFEFDELIARIHALIRRSKPNKELVLEYENVVVIPADRTVKVDNEDVELTKIEFNILEYLLRYSGTVVKQADLIESVWGEDSDLIDPPIRSHIKNLRKKIGDTELKTIQTIPGVGYKIG